MMNKPNIQMVRVDERLIHGQGQLWIKSLNVNLVICANDKVVTDPLQQTLMKTTLPDELAVRFWTIEKTAEIIWKAAPHQTIFVVVASIEDALRLCQLGFPLTELNIGNIHAAPDKEQITQFINLGASDKEGLRILRDQYQVIFNTRTSPVSADGTQHLDSVLKAIQ